MSNSRRHWSQRLSPAKDLGKRKGEDRRASLVDHLDAAAKDLLAILIPTPFEAVANEFDGCADCFRMRRFRAGEFCPFRVVEPLVIVANMKKIAGHAVAP